MLSERHSHEEVTGKTPFGVWQLGLHKFDERQSFWLVAVGSLDKQMHNMNYARRPACLAIILVAALISPVLAADGGSPLELDIQKAPGAGILKIMGGHGLVGIEYTTNLNQITNWSLLATVQTTNSPHFYTDTSATNAAKRFYRAVVEGGANPDPDHLVWIKPGTYLMGSPTNDADRVPVEEPQTRVTISQGFWMSKFETTQEEYLAVTGRNPSGYTGDLKHPVEQISWREATNYCAKLTVREWVAGRLPAGYIYRLPTEAEWEYACRAGTTTATAFGNSLSSTQANFWGAYPYGGAAPGPYVGTTTPVGSYAPNAWGLYDMHGNVDEWCSDWFSETLPGGNVTDPKGPNTGVYRVFRGGAYFDWGYGCRSAFRYSDEPGGWTDYIGFRPVLAPGQWDAVPGMVWIKPGTFMMGSPTNEVNRGEDESPQTQVTISQGFWMSQHETTQEEYQSVIGTNPSNFNAETNHPVENVRWDDATNYCAKLTVRERSANRLPAGYAYRLPTEAEWEYACRAGTTTATAYGNSLSSTQANFNGYFPYGGAADGPALRTTTQVGSYAPNAWGLYDMPGNVWEWCSDCFYQYPGGSVTDPQAPQTPWGRVVRGGSWYDYGEHCRSAERGDFPRLFGAAYTGFRPVLAPDQQNRVVMPAIVLQPKSQTIEVEAWVMFASVVRGMPLVCQWRFNGADIPGATDVGYFIASVQTTNAGNYSLVVSNSAGSVTSQVAVLTVVPRNPDPNNLVWISPDTFTMGSPTNEVGRAPDEGPQTQVTLSEGFWMGRFETTQGEYEAVMGTNPSYLKGDTNRPVELVSWDDATNYCARLTVRERAAGRLPAGYIYRLPTEAEWEYACRAGTTTATAFGNSLSSTQANFNGNFPYGGAAAGPYLGTTTPVGSYAPNAWGLYDMHGNVYEWCADRYSASLPGGSVTDPQGPNTGSDRVIRGGSLRFHGSFCRTADRESAWYDYWYSDVGFRIVLARGQ
jgi:sulfatase modifying factor 1